MLGIGLPVYNGELYLREALDSLLAQSFTDFEILICDNASTDATPAIAQEYAARDSRIRYQRNAENIGAAANFNLALGVGDNRYFKWAAHDDLLEPDFLASCVQALEGDPLAVLAASKVRLVDANGSPQGVYDPQLATDAPRSSARFAALLERHRCFQVFGVIRREALERTWLMQPHAYGDEVLLSQLALLGPFLEIPEFLFLARQHATNSTKLAGDKWQYTEWFDPQARGRRKLPNWRFLFDEFRAIFAAPLSLRDRLDCLRSLATFARKRSRLLRGDLLFYVRPVLASAGVPERLLRRPRS
jgi:glycosyltransferase involved in cell wall biosynthesis